MGIWNDGKLPGKLRSDNYVSFSESKSYIYIHESGKNWWPAIYRPSDLKIAWALSIGTWSNFSPFAGPRSVLSTLLRMSLPMWPSFFLPGSDLDNGNWGGFFGTASFSFCRVLKGVLLGKPGNSGQEDFGTLGKIWGNHHPGPLRILLSFKRNKKGEKWKSTIWAPSRIFINRVIWGPYKWPKKLVKLGWKNPTYRGPITPFTTSGGLPCMKSGCLNFGESGICLV